MVDTISVKAVVAFDLVEPQHQDYLMKHRGAIPRVLAFMTQI